MTREEAIKGLKSLVEVRREYGDMQTMKDEIECLEMAIKALEQQPCGDAISRQAVLDMATTIQTDDFSGNEIIEVVDVNDIKALSPVTPQPKYEDIAKAFQFGLAFGFGQKYEEMDRVIDEIKTVIAPQPKTGKTGHWIQLDYQRGKFECSECHTQGYVDTCMYEPKWKFCPNCGAKMVEPQESEG